MSKASIEDTGERMIPAFHKGKNVYGAHIGRYEAGKSVVKNKIVLDIACGSGYGTKIMSSTAKKVYGVDVDKDTVLYAKKNYAAKNIEYLLGDGTSIPLKDSSVDIVVSYETIEHINDYEKFMKEVKRVLKPQGLLLLSTPNDVEYGEGNHYHIHEFVYDELKQFVGKYFKFHKDYFQTLWMYSSIVPYNLHTTEWDEMTRTINTIPLKPEQCIYFFMLCSDSEIAQELEPVGVIGEHFRQREMQALGQKQREIKQNSKLLDTKVKSLKKDNELLSTRLKKSNEELELIKNNIAYKLIRKTKKFIK